jgi:amino acid adenylation domain-containing protein
MDDVLHRGFLERAAERPDEPALLWADGSMTYGEVARHAGVLAARLREHGVGPNALVGVSVPRGWQQVVAVLGVLIAGGAYLPIDVDLPEERRHHLVEAGDADVVVAVADEGSWPEGLVVLPAVDADVEPGGDLPLDIRQSAEDLAYVIFTSGSTGNPKGVAISHRAAWNTVDDINERFEVTPADRVLCVSSLSFDLSVYDLFGVLAAGGALVLPPPEARLDPRQWLALCEAHRVTIWNSVPALMELAVEQGELGGWQADPLRLVLMSGDWIPVSLPGRIRTFAPDAELISLGGATEAAIWSIFYPIGEIDPEWTSVPYGKPLRNQSWEVLNDRLNPCPAHVTGELYIGGMGLAEGYWRDEERTAAAFITHPRTGERLYRTGDLGRYMPDGNIEFLGREDSQVKVSGHRVELGEIEAHLTAHPRVRAAAVAAVGEAREHRRLVAYVVGDRQVEAGAESLAPERASGNGNGSAPPPSATGATVVDPLERLEFKLRRHGVRRLDSGLEVGLPTGGGADQRERRRELRLTSGSVSISALGGLLEVLRSAGDESGLPKYRYGSAGSLYPVQVYISVGPQQVSGVPAGTYYYDADAHALRGIPAASASLGVDAHLPHNRELAARSAFTIVLVADLDAIEPLYGTVARDFSLLEAGLMTQLLEGEARRCGIGVCQVPVPEAPAVHEAFALGANHAILHGLICGRSESGVPAGGGGDDDELWRDLRQWLASKLPHYMVPGKFVAIDQVPLTANGKVDRKQLASRGQSADKAADLPVEAVGPQLWAAGAAGGDFEALDIVCAALAEVLGERDAGAIQPDVPFIDLGLDSLGAVQLRNRIMASVGLTLPATVVFDYPTPRGVAQLMGEVVADLSGEVRVSTEDELARIEQRLRVLAESDSGRESVVVRLRQLATSLDLSRHEDDAAAHSDLDEATAEDVFELVDRELGA